MTAPLTPEEWEEVERLIRVEGVNPNLAGPKADLRRLLLRALAERTAERDEHAHVPMFYGEVMICEEHFWLLWPHGECAGPGMPLSGAKGYQDQLDALRLRVERIERETWEAAAHIIGDVATSEYEGIPSAFDALAGVASKFRARAAEGTRRGPCTCPITETTFDAFQSGEFPGRHRVGCPRYGRLA